MKSLAIHPFAQILTEHCNLLHARGLSPANSGNVSAYDEDILWVTASGCGMRDVRPENLVMLWPDGRMMADDGLKPSSELPMHQSIYKARPDARAVVHVHPPKATALAVAHQPLDMPLLSEAVIMLGDVPVVPYHLPGSQALADAVGEALSSHEAVLLANHGVVAVGRSLQEAYYHMELVESCAEIYILARQLNQLNPLNESQLPELYELKARLK